MGQLTALVNKPPIVSTYDARALQGSTGEVRDSYEWHAATYAEQPPLAELRRQFVAGVKDHKTPKACLVAPFGYGKTATAIGIWKACQDANAVAVPPISCSSLADIAKAVYEWLAFTLPERRVDIKAAHDSFLVSSVESLARRDERLFGISYDQAIAAITDKLDRGYLDFEDISLSLLGFLEKMAALVQDIGYIGLVIIVDELQQLLGNANKGVLVALRQLIWGLRTRQLALGILITMDPDTERALSERAGDILHRIKDDGLYLDMRNIYGREFPQQLWDQYCAALGLERQARRAIDKHALASLGQLCERDDLSNGPRTVINVFQLAAARFEQGIDLPYSPIDLINDLLAGAIRFDGDRSILPSLVTELLNFPYFQKASERGEALKLVAAFPRGCSETVAAAYSLKSAWRKVRQDLHGEIVTELDEGLSLIELQRVTRPANQINVLLRRYWMHITDHQIIQEDIERVFAELIVPLLFRPKAHDLSGWAGLDNILLTTDGGYAGIVEGTFSARFPLRKVAIIVVSGNDPLPLLRGSADVDITVVFRLDLSTEASSGVATDSAGVFEFRLALLRPSRYGLTGGLAWIAHYLSPHPITPAVMLGLLRYIGNEPTGKLTERDRIRFEDLVARLQEWLLAELLPPSLFVDSGYAVVQAGQEALRELFHLHFVARWPTYSALLAHQHWRVLAEDYIKALGKISPAARIGNISVTDTKAEIAKLFGQNKHAGLESRLKQYGGLLQVEAWSGDQARVLFKPHFAEMQLVGYLRSEGGLSDSAIYRHLRLMGYASVEVRQLIQLVIVRGLIENKAGLLSLPQAPSRSENEARAKSLLLRSKTLSANFGAPDIQVPVDTETLQDDADPLATKWRLDRFENQIMELETRKNSDEKLINDGIRTLIANVLPRLSSAVTPAHPGELEGHLTALQKQLEQERRKLEPMVANLSNSKTQIAAAESKKLIQRANIWYERGLYYDRWNGFAGGVCRLQNAARRIGRRNGPFYALDAGLIRLGQEGRAILAQLGISGLTEIGHLEAKLTQWEREYNSLAAERKQAFDQLGKQLLGKLRSILRLPSKLSWPEYDLAHEDRSYEELCHWISQIASRSIALLKFDVTMDDTSASARQPSRRLLKDIQRQAELASSPDWLLSGPRPELKSKAIEEIKALRQRVSPRGRSSSRKSTSSRTRVTALLSELVSGPVDITSFLTDPTLNGNADFLKELSVLQHVGELRFVVDLLDGKTPATPKDGNKPKTSS
jgi:hypothetical protein